MVLVGVGRYVYASGGVSAASRKCFNETCGAGGCNPGLAATSLASVELLPVKFTASSTAVDVARGYASVPDGGNACAAERDVLRCFEESYALSLLVRRAGLGAPSYGMLGRPRANPTEAEEDRICSTSVFVNAGVAVITANLYTQARQQLVQRWAWYGMPYVQRRERGRSKYRPKQ